MAQYSGQNANLPVGGFVTKSVRKYYAKKRAFSGVVMVVLRGLEDPANCARAVCIISS